MRVVLANSSRGRREAPQSLPSKRKLIPTTPITAKPPTRRPYETPVVRSLGSISTLTRGGGGTSTDAGGSKPHTGHGGGGHK